MSEAFQPILRYGSPWSYPGVPCSTMRFEISLRPSGVSPVTAVIATCPLISVPALVMNCLAPLTTQPSSSRTARVFTFPASLPASGSVRPNAPSLRPAHRSGM